MIVLFIEGWGIGKKWVSKSPRKEIAYDESHHEGH